MKATKDFFILDSEVRLHDELGGGVVCVSLSQGAIILFRHRFWC